MLSKQADELRALAGDGSVEWVAGPIRASVLRDAADTILSLRDRAQELKAENARLRDGYEAYEHRMDCLVSSLTGGLLSKSASTPNDVIYEAVQEEMTEELLAENARLRELVRDYHAFLALADLAQPIGHVTAAGGRPSLSVKALDERYREMEIEVG